MKKTHFNIFVFKKMKATFTLVLALEKKLQCFDNIKNYYRYSLNWSQQIYIQAQLNVIW
jgi:hypothetical protein